MECSIVCGSMPQLPEDFEIWVVLATLGALALAIMLGLLRMIFRVENNNAGGKLSSGTPRASKKMRSAEADPRFPDREPFTLDEFYEKYYAEHEFPRAVVLDVLTRFAAAVGVPASVLRPEDTLASLTVLQPDSASGTEPHSSAVRTDISKASYARLDGVHPDAEAFQILAVETA